MLQGIELGLMTPDQSYRLLDDADPTLVHLIVKWLKKHYHRDHEQAEEVHRRLAEVLNTHRSLTRKAKEGESDPIVDWFEGTYKYRDLSAEEFIDVVVEKLEG
ncbi:MAG: hypothetical protein KDK70_17345 [Myxococcales bacterium]|nr:hypothetical protein [Myxococcales bacterium]